MINIDVSIEELLTLSATLSEKAEQLNSSLLYTEDDAVANLKEKLVAAVEILNADIENLKSNVANANNNKKW
jgi:molybdopterin converting factor small subunit